mmetsp:Transcript_11736/g.22513  ORF Transcript_11736/g.22513 Transcript_11736/m.22513 type:complete len:415 (-) Transcript_11736:40-1284(-)
MKLLIFTILALYHTTLASHFDGEILSYHQPLEEGRTLVDVTTENPNLSTIAYAKLSTEFASLLSSAGNFTFFAPDNNAFGYMHVQTPELQEALFSAPWHQHLRSLLAFHVIADDAIFSSNVQESTAVQTLNGDYLYLTSYEGHFLVWPTLHGGYAHVVTPDNGSTNGVAHFIDSVLLAHWLTRTLMDMTAEIPYLSTFKQLMVSTGLDYHIAHWFGYTVLAPTNSAFEHLDDETMAYLQSPNGEKDLVNLLTNHVVSEVIPSNLFHLSGESSVQTNFGTELSIEYLAEDSAKINGANVLTFDVLASNGILHVIDSVLIPPYIKERKEGSVGVSENLPKPLSASSANHGTIDTVLEEETTDDGIQHGSEHAENAPEIDVGSGNTSKPNLNRIIEYHRPPMTGKLRMNLRRGVHST